MIKKTLVSHAAFGPIEYFAHLTKGPVIIEKNSHYSRQTFRNRYVIMGANGPLPLTIPVENKKGEKTLDKDVRIAYHTHWQSNHWHSLISAYNSSPFFQFYSDEIEPFFKEKYKWLFEYNIKATKIISELLGFEPNISFSDAYITPPAPEILDLRESIHPKRKSEVKTKQYNPVPYKQVFDDRHGFTPNLSILDLLFNKGPEAILVLQAGL